MSDEIKAALTALLLLPRNRAVMEDYLASRIADAKRMQARRIQDDASDGGDTLAVSAPSGLVGWTVDGCPIGNVSGHFSAYGSVIAGKFGTVVDGPSIRTTLSKVNRRTSSPMSDRRSSVAPIVPTVAGSRGLLVSTMGQVITWGMSNALSVLAPEVLITVTDEGIYARNSLPDIWHALETIVRDGFKFPLLRDGIYSDVSMPFNPVAMRRSIDAAHKDGHEYHVDRLDDVISDAVERAYTALAKLSAESLPDDVVTHDGSAHAPMGHVAGYLVLRAIRCGTCGPCQHNGSRFFVGQCQDPGSVVEYQDAQRILSRALYASASASVTTERKVRPTAEGLPTGSASLDEGFDCGHGPSCRREPCKGQNVLHASRVACEALGLETVAPNGRATTEVLDFIALSLGNAPTERGRQYALVKLNALLNA